jgi:poly(3-hydroxybutyrate) depolymerase
VLDLPAEFYLETVDRVFQEALLAAGRTDLARPQGRPVRHPPHRAAHGRGRARRHLRLGQTVAAHDLCSG